MIFSHDPQVQVQVQVQVYGYTRDYMRGLILKKMDENVPLL